MKNTFFVISMLIFCALLSQETNNLNLMRNYSHTTEEDSIFVLGDSVSISEDVAYLDSIWRVKMYNSPAFSVSELDCKDECGNIDFNLNDSIVKNVLDSLNRHTPFNLDYNYHVKSYIKSYIKKHELVAKTIGLSHYYFPYFENVFAKYNIPLEMKYLAVVESALNPKARSHAGAAGIWQFIYSTGKIYDLNVTSYVDERYDVMKSTVSAAKFLSKLYEIFGDWNLVLAAYNSGPRNVTKAMRRSGKKNYWGIWHYLPKETRGYVPSFIAVNYIMNNYSHHNIKPQNPRVTFLEIDTIKINETIKFEEISKFTGIPMNELKFLNPSYKLDIIPKTKDKDYFLILPTKYSDIFLDNEKEIYAHVRGQRELDKDKLPKYTKGEDSVRYKVKRGDVLISIAKKYGVSVRSIKSWNKIRGNTIYVGQRLTIFPRKI